MEKQQTSKLTMPVTPEAISATLAILYAEDADFRAAFDKDPKATVAKVSGQEIPSDVEIVVHRNDPKRWHITLPVEGMDVAQLGDKEMGDVAGGVSFFTGAGMIGCITGNIVAALCPGACCSQEPASGTSAPTEAQQAFAADPLGPIIGALSTMRDALNRAGVTGSSGSGG